MADSAGKHNCSTTGTGLLIIEDDVIVRCSLADYFRDSGYQVYEAEHGQAGVEIFKEKQPDLVFTDLRMPVMDGLAVIKAIRELSPETPVIVISGTAVVSDAVASLRQGAWDYVEKPLYDMAELEHMVNKALETSGLRRQVAGLKQKLLGGGLRKPELFADIITRNAAMTAIFQYIEVIAPTMQPVLITGETGTGKELLARAVHTASGRNGDFVAINVAGLDDQMFSDTLFGHCRGAFTGADKVREGLIARAAGGTLFLDEIGDLKEASQIKLLRLLQEGEYFPLGADHPRISKARVVLATHRDLKELVAGGVFREDLYYRLFTHQICIPPLRNRFDDLPLLLDAALTEAASLLGRKKPDVPAELPDYLKTHHFSGNVRELKAMVLDAVSRYDQAMIPLEPFLKAINHESNDDMSKVPGSFWHQMDSGNDTRMPTLEEAEQFLIKEAMKRANNNQGVAASYLGINRSALNKRLQKRKHPS